MRSQERSRSPPAGDAMGRVDGAGRQHLRNKICGYAPKHAAVVITMARDEANFFPFFLRYYSQHFAPNEIVVLDHLTQDGSLNDGFTLNRLPSTLLQSNALGGCPFIRVDLLPALGKAAIGFNTHFCPDLWRPKVLAETAALLLESGSVGAVICVDVDEIVCLDPGKNMPGSCLRAFLDGFVEAESDSCSRELNVKKPCAYLISRGFEIHHNIEGHEPPVEFHRDLLSQRRLMFSNPMYAKPVILRSRVELSPGNHVVFSCADVECGKLNGGMLDPRVLLLHLHRMDFDIALCRHQKYWDAEQQGLWDPRQHENVGFQYRQVNPRLEFVEGFWGKLTASPGQAAPTWIVRPWRAGSEFEARCGEPEWIPELWRREICI